MPELVKRPKAFSPRMVSYLEDLPTRTGRGELRGNISLLLIHRKNEFANTLDDIAPLFPTCRVQKYLRGDIIPNCTI